MAETVNDLLVRITPDGVDETADELDQARDSFEETADVAGESAADLEGFANRWQGAMAAITAGLIAGAAVLLSRVPVLGESMSALNAIIDAFALRLDSVLRPALGDINTALFEFSNVVAQAQGPLGLLFDAISVVVGIIGPAIVAIAAVGSQMGTWASTIAGVEAILGSLASMITTAISSIAGFIASSTAAAAAVGALLGTLGVAVLEVTGVLGAFEELGAMLTGPALDAIVTFGSAITLGLLPLIASLGAALVGFVRGTLEGGFSEGLRRAKQNAIEAFSTIASSITSTIGRLETLLFDAGAGLVDELIDGMLSKAQDLANAAKTLAGEIADHMPSSPAETGPLADLDQAGPGLVETVAGGMERSAGRLEQASGRVAMAADPRDGGGRRSRRDRTAGGRDAVARQLGQLVQAMQQSRRETVLELDGQTVARQLEPLLGEGAVLSGATQVRR